jgi:hypothetical protein
MATIPCRTDTAGMNLLHRSLLPESAVAMKSLAFFFLLVLSISGAVGAQPFVTLPEGTIEYRTRNSLMIVPVKINDTLRVMLAIDPQCKNVVLFGKRYRRFFESSEKTQGVMANNKIEIGALVGQNVPILIVPNTNPLNFFTCVNGVIGAHYFTGYELQINYRKQTLTIKAGTKREPPVTGLLQNPTSALDFLNFD